MTICEATLDLFRGHILVTIVNSAGTILYTGKLVSCPSALFDCTIREIEGFGSLGDIILTVA